MVEEICSNHAYPDNAQKVLYMVDILEICKIL